MNTIILKFALAAVIIGIALSAMATDATSAISPASVVPTDARFSSDKPEIKTLFQHTSEKPYDIKCLTWYGGVMERIVAENKSSQPVTIHFVMAHLINGVVVVPAHRTTVIKDCAPGETVTLMDLLSKDGDSAVAYQFTHESVITEPAVAGHVTAATRLSMNTAQ